jgi:hypothetical protein
MATKTIDVTFETMRNVGTRRVSPEGFTRCAIARAIDDEQIFQVGLLYDRNEGQPMHPSGALGLPPGQSLSYNVTRRLTVSHYDQETVGHLNQMLIFNYELKQRVVASTGRVELVSYFGTFNYKVRYEEIDGFNTFTLPYSASFEGVEIAKIEVAYTVNLISG